jgi:DNA-binding IclR family transcriptional regulator
VPSPAPSQTQHRDRADGPVKGPGEPSAIAKIVWIVESFAGRPRHLTWVVEATGLTLTSVHRILNELVEHGWIRRTGGRGYAPTSRLARMAPARPDAMHAAVAVVEAIAVSPNRHLGLAEIAAAIRLPMATAQPIVGVLLAQDWLRRHERGFILGPTPLRLRRGLDQLGPIRPEVRGG